MHLKPLMIKDYFKSFVSKVLRDEKKTSKLHQFDEKIVVK